MDLSAERDRLAAELTEADDWIERMRRNKEVMADPRKRQQVDRVEDQWIKDKLKRYEHICDLLNQPAQAEMGEVA